MDHRRILIADDHETTLNHLEEILSEWGYQVTTADNGDRAWEILQASDAPRLAILDRRMPGIDGLEICRRVRTQAQEPYIYILLLTVFDQEKHIAAGLHAGADDYIVKPFRTHELQARLDAARRILEIQRQLIDTRDRLHSQATTDPVTGLWNRAAITDILQRELSRSARSKEPVGLVMVDLDRFKQINDEYGHPAGDAVLLECGQRMRSAVRTYDATGRFGGDEFLSIHPGCDLEICIMLGRRLRERLAEAPVLFNGIEIPVTGSVGVASSEMILTLEAEALIFLADAALYEAKRAGRNCLQVARA